jgi:flagellar basal body rod protein FlgB
MNVEFENIETLFTYQLRGILAKTEAEVAEVKERIKVMGKELEILGKEPSEEDHNTIDLAAQFIALANIIRYQVKAELFNRRFELN